MTVVVTALRMTYLGDRDCAARLRAVLIQLIEPDQHVAGFAPIRRAEYSSIVQLVDDPGGASVADAQPSLKQ